MRVSPILCNIDYLCQFTYFYPQLFSRNITKNKYFENWKSNMMTLLLYVSTYLNKHSIYYFMCKLSYFYRNLLQLNFVKNFKLFKSARIKLLLQFHSLQFIDYSGNYLFYSRLDSFNWMPFFWDTNNLFLGVIHSGTWWTTSFQIRHFLVYTQVYLINNSWFYLLHISSI